MPSSCYSSLAGRSATVTIYEIPEASCGWTVVHERDVEVAVAGRLQRPQHGCVDPLVRVAERTTAEPRA